MKDKFNVRGYIKIESLDKNGKVIDTYEHHNLIDKIYFLDLMQEIKMLHSMN